MPRREKPLGRGPTPTASPHAAKPQTCLLRSRKHGLGQPLGTIKIINLTLRVGRGPRFSMVSKPIARIFARELSMLPTQLSTDGESLAADQGSWRQAVKGFLQDVLVPSVRLRAAAASGRKETKRTKLGSNRCTFAPSPRGGPTCGPMLCSCRKLARRRADGHTAHFNWLDLPGGCDRQQMDKIPQHRDFSRLFATFRYFSDQRPSWPLHAHFGL